MSRRQPLLLPPFTSFPLATSFPPPACPPLSPYLPAARRLAQRTHYEGRQDDYEYQYGNDAQQNDDYDTNNYSAAYPTPHDNEYDRRHHPATPPPHFRPASPLPHPRRNPADDYDSNNDNVPRPDRNPVVIRPDRHRDLTNGQDQPRKKARTTPALPKVEAGFVGGQTPKGKTNISHLTEPAASIIPEAQHAFEMLIFTKHGYPDDLRVERWAMKTLTAAGAKRSVSLSATDRLLGMVKSYGWHGRSNVGTVVCQLFDSHYRFEPGSSPADVAKNLQLYKDLIEGSAFHYEDPKTYTGYAQHVIIRLSLKKLWFRARDDLGIKNADLFNPILLPTLALIFTAIEHWIQCWSTGHYVHAKFTESLNRERYGAHLTDLSEWAALVPEATQLLLTSLYTGLRDRGTGHSCSRNVALFRRARAMEEMQAMLQRAGEAAAVTD
ncbi:hypothetical protein GGX14DRAFT_570311 [Mycena pura]|uniref:DUF6532 domain-containing protein n=1 Tax=Mycena pura TaxID=153505 RepID=A0AAD6V5Y6_9AGAR|nr:hypothetical protein GGX14DRAFT_570311 [Mycena pura]